jgi:hypothetical protein
VEILPVIALFVLVRSRRDFDNAQQCVEPSNRTVRPVVAKPETPITIAAVG